MSTKKNQQSVKRLRNYRVYHKVIGLVLAILLMISAVTGFFLGWKKNLDLLQPPTQKGVSTEMASWKSTEELASIADAALMKQLARNEALEIDRLDFRPSKGIVKVLYVKGWWEVQVDCQSGAVLSIAKRHSDWIEKLHDGSIISDLFKLISMNILGLGLSIMILTGFWLWYGPRIIRGRKRRREA